MSAIPDAAVEAAARNMFDLRATELDQSRIGWGDLPESWREEWRDGARAVLAAAAPYIAEVTEAAVRERVARDIAQRQLVSTDTAAILAYDDAARIVARGGVA